MSALRNTDVSSTADCSDRGCTRRRFVMVQAPGLDFSKLTRDDSPSAQLFQLHASSGSLWTCEHRTLIECNNVNAAHYKLRLCGGPDW
ncbi:uncharacterized protein UDID_17753 [Ustilago sp. UG-2017a]|nr:uncharacterized protein UDID_17753 [Ustilago sp. UG-2017a]